MASSCAIAPFRKPPPGFLALAKFKAATLFLDLASSMTTFTVDALMTLQTVFDLMPGGVKLPTIACSSLGVMRRLLSSEAFYAAAMSTRLPEGAK